MEPIIRAKNISLIYDLGKSNETRALSDVTVEIFPEEYVIFFGPSGCGKSTFLYIIAGLMRPTSGDIIVSGSELNKLDENDLVSFHQKTIGMVFQAYYLIPYLTAKDNVVMPQIFLNVPKEERDKKALELMERFELSKVKDRRSTMLSGGQQQRVAIARALINSAPIILADEPVGNLDSKNAATVLQLIDDLNKKDKKTIIQVTHDPSHLSFADRVFYFRDGKLERIVVNKKEEKKPAAKPAEAPKLLPAPHLIEEIKKPKEPFSDFDKMALLYPNLSESRIKAKLYVNYLLLPHDLDTMIRVEEIIEKYILGESTREELLVQLDLPLEKGGAGLNFQAAKGLAHKILEIADEAKQVQAAPVKESETQKTQVVLLREFLLDRYDGQIDLAQIERLERGISLRLEQKFSDLELKKFFDAPLAEGGAGLNSRTAKKFADEIEIILARKSQ